MSSLALVITIAHFTSAEGGAATAVPSSARLGAREDDDWKDLMVFGSLMCFRWRSKGTYLTKYVEVSPKKAFDCLSMFLHLMGPKMLQCDQHQICNAYKKEVALESK